MTLIIQKPTGAKLNLAQTYVGIDDPDAAVYVAAVEAADGEALETATKVAIHSFVKGCKADGIWPAIKASCILAGARTLTGALVPLVGAAPTNFNFVSGDYNRKTGLVGDGSTKYLDSNRNNNADPQDSNHNAVYVSSAGQSGALGIYIGAGETASGANNLGRSGGTPTDFIFRNRASNTSLFVSANQGAATGFAGASRSNASNFVGRVGGSNSTFTHPSGAVSSFQVFIFKRESAGITNARLAFYSIGESLNLALLDARVTDLINAFAAAIP
jgi:hypothetical protein